jgi:hypothetical protein
MSITKPVFYDSLTRSDKAMYNAAEWETSRQWANALTLFIEEIGGGSDCADASMPEDIVKHLRERIKYLEQRAADEELEACDRVLDEHRNYASEIILSEWRRPQPTLKSQALKDFESVRKNSDLLPEILDTIEKTIERAVRAQLFEINDPITRSNFVNIVEPYLRERGITEFLLVCDESNNTPDVIDSNQFKADIYVKPARSINFIRLTFVATRTGISFSEIVGTV